MREAFFTWLRRLLLPGRVPGPELPEGLSASEDEPIAKSVIDAVGAP
jgi:hypothetical protein